MRNDWTCQKWLGNGELCDFIGENEPMIDIDSFYSFSLDSFVYFYSYTVHSIC